MNEEHRQFMNLVARAPGRLTAEQTAWLLNCQRYDIPVLIEARLLRPLGNPVKNAPKFFAADELLELARDRAWLSRMTSTLQQYWMHRNRQKEYTGAVATIERVPLGRGRPDGAAK